MAKGTPHKAKFNKLFPSNVCMVQNHPYIFTGRRVDRKTVPEDMYIYEVRDDCDGEFWQIQDRVMVNFWGTIIGMDPIVYTDDKSYICPPEEEDEDYSSEGWFVNDYVRNIEEYLDLVREYKGYTSIAGEEL